MVKIHVFAVRYKENPEPFIKRFYADPIVKSSNINLTIINNYDYLSVEDPRVKVINNTLRPDFSTGHLSRNWNEAIINGFRDLNLPSVDYVIGVQIDAILGDTWYQDLMKVLKIYPELHYLALGEGDEFQVFTPQVIKTVGLYDERFCNIGYQEADYFYRVRLLKPLNAVILDHKHGRVMNNIGLDELDVRGIVIRNPSKEVNDAHRLSMAHHNDSLKVFYYKWGHTNPEHWTEIEIDPGISRGKEFRYYPYFEKAVDPWVYVIQ